MVEDRKQKPNSWDEKVSSVAVVDRTQRLIDSLQSKMSRFRMTVLFLCGFCCGMAFILLLVN